MAKTQYYGTGRRKSSVARVRLVPGTGNITVNKKSLDDYLAMEIVKREVKRPFEIAGCEGKFDVIDGIWALAAMLAIRKMAKNRILFAFILVFIFSANVLLFLIMSM